MQDHSKSTAEKCECIVSFLCVFNQRRPLKYDFWPVTSYVVVMWTLNSGLVQINSVVTEE